MNGKRHTLPVLSADSDTKGAHSSQEKAQTQTPLSLVDKSLTFKNCDFFFSIILSCDNTLRKITLSVKLGNIRAYDNALK